MVTAGGLPSRARDRSGRRIGRRRSGWKSLRGSTVMSHDPPFGGDGQSSDQVTEVEPGQRRPPAPSRTSRVEGILEEPCISRVTTQDEATSANPASQSQTSRPKTHSAYQPDNASRNDTLNRSPAKTP